jgi:pimeloyl-ACP methyl ester carboxylesterase
MSISETQLLKLHTDVIISFTSTQPSAQSIKGNLPTIVFLHYWGGSSLTWSQVVPRISIEFPTVSIDFRGWGSSTGPHDKDGYTIQALADDVQAVIALLRLKSVILAGLSMGAKVAQLTAAQIHAVQEGERAAVAVQGLVLVSPAPVTPLILPPDMRAQQLRAYENGDTATIVARNVLTTTFRDRDLPDFVVSDMLRGSELAKQAWPAYAMGEDVSAAVGKLQTAAVVLAAELDTVEPLERVVTETCARLPDAQLFVLKGSGHLSPLDAPEALSQHILQFARHVSKGRPN